MLEMVYKKTPKSCLQVYSSHYATSPIYIFTESPRVWAFPKECKTSEIFSLLNEIQSENLDSEVFTHWIAQIYFNTKYKRY